jgi:aryl-alcohol dehydrogenase-like predicted oxidoreductase
MSSIRSTRKHVFRPEDRSADTPDGTGSQRDTMTIGHEGVSGSVDRSPSQLDVVDETATFGSSDFRNIVPRFSAENRKANQAVVDLLTRIAERKRATPAQVALAWLLAPKPGIVPIPGTTKLHRLEENSGAVNVELTADDLREIENASAKITVQGARYPDHLQ